MNPRLECTFVPQNSPHTIVLFLLCHTEAEDRTPCFSFAPPAPYFDDPLCVPGAELYKLHHPGNPVLTAS